MVRSCTFFALLEERGTLRGTENGDSGLVDGLEDVGVTEACFEGLKMGG